MPERSGAVLRRRQHAERQFVHTCTTVRYSETESPLEGERKVRTPNDYLVNQPCYYYTVSAREESLSGAAQSGQAGSRAIVRKRVAKVQFPFGTDVHSGDAIKTIVDQHGVTRNAKPFAIDAAVTLDTHIEIDATEISKI